MSDAKSLARRSSLEIADELRRSAMPPAGGWPSPASGRWRIMPVFVAVFAAILALWAVAAWQTRLYLAEQARIELERLQLAESGAVARWVIESGDPSFHTACRGMIAARPPETWSQWARLCESERDDGWPARPTERSE